MKAFARTAEIDALVDAYTGSLAAAGTVFRLPERLGGA